MGGKESRIPDIFRGEESENCEKMQRGIGNQKLDVLDGFSAEHEH